MADSVPFKSDVMQTGVGKLMYASKTTNMLGVEAENTRICVVMVGLPARGKSYIAQKRK
jgi:hypothetical protein